MGRLVAEHFGPTGKPKTAYPDRAAVLAAGRRYRGAYKCSVCHAYHGATKSKPRNARRR